MALRKSTKKTTADKVNYSLVFTEPEEGEEDYEFKSKEYREARQWLDQFYPCTALTIASGRRHLLIVGTESYVEEVWSMKNNNYKGTCYLEWRRPEE
jgi:hypothetical protein